MVVFILFLLFLILPAFEIYLFIKIGTLIGFWSTLGFIFLTAFVGAFLVKQQGVSVLTRMQERVGREEIPTQEFVEAFLLLLAGFLLITPGFFTDGLGFLLLMPPVRAFFSILVVDGFLGGILDAVGVVQWAAGKANRPTPAEEGVIEAEFKVEKKTRRP